MLKNSLIFKFLIRHLLLQKYSILKLLGISLISSTLVVLQPLLMQKLIDNAFILRKLDDLYFWATLIFILGIFGILIASYNQYTYTKLSTQLLFNFRSDIFGKLFLHKKEFFQKYNSGDLLTRLEGDISEIQRFGTDSIFSITSASFGMIGALIIMFLFEPTLALISILLLPIEFFLLKPLYSKMTQKTMNVRQSQSYIGSFMVESLRYALFFKTFDYILQRNKDLKKLQSFHRDNILDQQKLQIVFSQIPVLVSLLGRGILVFWGGIKVIEGQMQVGEFIAFLTYFGMILGPIQTYLGVLNNIPKVKVSLERLNIFIPNYRNGKKEIVSRPNIYFENVYFQFGNKELFNNFNLKIPYGEKVVILGSNGVGKSTFIELLLNLHEIKSGSIKLSENSIYDISLSSLYSTIGCVEQHPVILASSLKENLKIAKSDVKNNELVEALKKVGLETWFNSLSKGLETNLSESGQSLSGGQRQRISIARLILKNPSIIILDEYTSSQDKNFAKEIEEKIDVLFANRTRIVISHKTNHTNSRVFEIKDKGIKEII